MCYIFDYRYDAVDIQHNIQRDEGTYYYLCRRNDLEKLPLNLQFFAKDGPGGEKTEEPTAKKLEDAVKGLEEELSAAHIFPEDWTAKYSIGKGNLASVMWVVFLPPGQTTQDGIYVSICFGKAGNGLVAGCAISNTSQKKV